MSISTVIEFGLTVLGLAGVIGLWIYAARHSEPRDVMLLLGASLAVGNQNERQHH